MFCYKCGAKLPDDASFCVNCGSQVSKQEENQQFEVNKSETFTAVEPDQIPIQQPQVQVPPQPQAQVPPQMPPQYYYPPQQPPIPPQPPVAPQPQVKYISPEEKKRIRLSKMTLMFGIFAICLIFIGPLVLSEIISLTPISMVFTGMYAVLGICLFALVLSIACSIVALILSSRYKRNYGKKSAGAKAGFILGLISLILSWLLIVTLIVITIFYSSLIMKFLQFIGAESFFGSFIV